MEQIESNFEEKKKNLILIVDDNPINSKVVANHLKREGFDIAVTANGTDTITFCEERIPDLILLDIMMPGMDGYQLCQIIKSSAYTKDIPIIFLTAKVSPDEILKGFQLGAVDYIVKPFNSAELLARVNTHIKLKTYLSQIEEKNKELEALNIEKNELLGIAAHDLKNPIYNIAMLAKVLRDEKGLSEDEIFEFSQDIVTTAERMLDLIRKLLDINAIEQGKVNITKEKVDLVELAGIICDIYKERANIKDIQLFFKAVDENCYVNADKNATLQILDNIISNSIKYTPLGKNVYVEIINNQHYGKVIVRDEGPGLSREDQKKLFGKFVKLSSRPTGDEQSTGLGLSIVKRFVESMDGRVWCESELGQGSSFIFEIPKYTES